MRVLALATRAREQKALLAGAMLLVMVFTAGAALAQSVPTKTITIYNNSDTETLYTMIQSSKKQSIPGLPAVADLWMQAQFAVTNPSTQTFNSSLLYEIYVNPNSGIPPHKSVTITLPFYTQLLQYDSSNLGTVSDQFIDWWNAMRVYIFDGKDALTAATNRNLKIEHLPSGDLAVWAPPVTVNPVAGAAVASCTSDAGLCEVTVGGYIPGIPPYIPFQLVEYTFASASGPPLAPLPFTIDIGRVNYNISAVDSIYLPAAIGAHHNSTKDNTYLGTKMSLTDFRAALNDFKDTKSTPLWPYFLGGYYATHSIVPLQTPPAGVNTYPMPEIPSTNTVYAESFDNPPPAPPVLSSDTLAAVGDLGTVAQGTMDLWLKCAAEPTKSSTCAKIDVVSKFFADDYNKCFPGASLPNTEAFLRDVYGWVQFPGCTAVKSLADNPGYAEAIKTYCDLQYNYLDTSVPSEDWFNPYVRLVHSKLQSNAYGFSIDDAVSFKSIPGDGVIITIGGDHGLENVNQTDLPDAGNYHKFCEGAPVTRTH